MTHRPVRILLADDNTENRRAVARALSGMHITLDTAAVGAAAVEMAARTRYDIVLMDVEMPTLDGLQAAAAIRAAERRSEEEPVPVVAFTAHDPAGLRERCLAAGMNDVVAKPAVNGDLVNAIYKWADRRPAVLVADDSFEVRQFVRQRLRDTPCRVVAATNGEEAVYQFDRQPITLVLLDMNMPVLDGFATAAAIRAREDGRTVPIVALTASDDEEVRTRASAAGCDMHVVKPVNGRLLVSIVHAALDGLAPISRVEFAESQASGPGDVVVQVEPFMADLVPEYVREKRRQVRELRHLLDAGDMRQVQRIAHDLKGTGTAYGIPDVTRLGRELEAAGQRADAAAASALVEELDTLLAGVQRRLGA